MSNSIEISIQMFEFQKRCWWMLSSLCEQLSLTEKLYIRISTHKEDRYKEITKKMIKTFDTLLDIKIVEYGDAEYGYRGRVRNRDILESRGDWIFFSDSDMIFHNLFFNDISSRLERFKGTGLCLTAPRWNVNTEQAYQMIDKEKYENKIILNSFGKCWDKKEGYSCGGRAPGAGYFQVVETKYLKDNNVTYSDKKVDRSLFNSMGNKYKSDRRFRKKMEGVHVFKKKKEKDGSMDVLKPIIHLNHWRKRQKDKWRDICR